MQRALETSVDSGSSTEDSVGPQQQDDASSDATSSIEASVHGSSVSRDASQNTGTAEWTGKYQGFLDKRSNSRFSFFGSRWDRRWWVRSP